MGVDQEGVALIDVVIQGTGKLGQMVFYLLRESTKHRVVAFAADRQYCTTEQLLGVPLIPFDQVERQFPPDGVGMLDRTIAELLGKSPKSVDNALQRIKTKAQKILP